MNKSFLIHAEELAALGGDSRAPHEPQVLIVDTRGEPEFAEGHVPGAVNLPSGRLFDPEGVGSRMLPTAELRRILAEAGIDGHGGSARRDDAPWTGDSRNDGVETEPPRRLVLYDDSGLVPSAKVFWVLEQLGWENMCLLNGGLTGWIRRGFPVESGAPAMGSGTEPKSDLGSTWTDSLTTQDRVADREDVRAALEREDVVIVDARSAEEYQGLSGAHQRNGHIPGARHVDWQNHIVDLFDPHLRPLEEVAELYRSVGVTEDKEIITYCRTASRSAHSYFVLRLLGYSRVRNYAGSWVEWCADPSLPVEGPG